MKPMPNLGLDLVCLAKGDRFHFTDLDGTSRDYVVDDVADNGDRTQTITAHDAECSEWAERLAEAVKYCGA